ncbi:MAG: imelysin family protein [Verrucomicrobiota bacterium]
MRFPLIIIALLTVVYLEASAGRFSQRAALHYAAIAHARYDISMRDAKELQERVNDFLNKPDAESHQAAKDAWLKAHNTYSLTEVFRFGNPNVDAWEGKVNAWPLDEGYIDYVADNYVYHVGNPHARHNIIGIAAYPIRDEIIAEYQSGTDPKEAPSQRMTDIETNVAIGFHAIEFLLWGQDLNEDQTVGGKRSYTDYLKGSACTNGNCDRRSKYLSAASRVLVQDLQFMALDWSPNGRYYKDFVALTSEEQLWRILTGMGSLSYAELAGERMRVALIAADQEEEQNCFSDTTQYSVYYNALGIQSLYYGEQKDIDGETIRGVSLSNLVRRYNPDLDEKLRLEFSKTKLITTKLLETAAKDMPFDRMILPENEDQRAVIESVIDALKEQTITLEAILAEVSELAKL